MEIHHPHPLLRVTMVVLVSKMTVLILVVVAAAAPAQSVLHPLNLVLPLVVMVVTDYLLLFLGLLLHMLVVVAAVEIQVDQLVVLAAEAMGLLLLELQRLALLIGAAAVVVDQRKAQMVVLV